jgi:hypothetical protein
MSAMGGSHSAFNMLIMINFRAVGCNAYKNGDTGPALGRAGAVCCPFECGRDAVIAIERLTRLPYIGSEKTPGLEPGC